MKVLKRNGDTVDFDMARIARAISNANLDVEPPKRLSDGDIEVVCNSVRGDLYSDTVTVEEIQDIVEQHLMQIGSYDVAKKYMLYRYERGLVRQSNTTDDSILKLVRLENKQAMEENSNKNAIILSTQRDLIAGEVSRDLTGRLLLPKHISEAHEQGVLHFHDGDYFLQMMFNCCVENMKDMLDNGTCINNKMIESPKSFQVACTVMTQIIAAVASSQYGGQSVNIKHLGRYLRMTYDKEYKAAYTRYYNNLRDEKFDDFLTIASNDVNYAGKDAAVIECHAVKLLEEQAKWLASISAEAKKKDELKGGVQTIQYQINTLMSTNGFQKMAV